MIGLHITFGTYGFWLPNDPRGSGSSSVWAPHLLEYGPATYIEDRRRSRASVAHDRSLRTAAKKSLLRPPVILTGRQALAAVTGFGEALEKAKIPCWACCIMPNHMHIVVASGYLHHKSLELRLKAFATRKLNEYKIHPFASYGEPQPKCWQRGGWTTFLNSESDIRRAIEYVKNNPIRDGKKELNWPFVTQYLG